jgi:hypothetical protein
VHLRPTISSIVPTASSLSAITHRRVVHHDSCSSSSDCQVFDLLSMPLSVDILDSIFVIYGRHPSTTTGEAQK